MVDLITAIDCEWLILVNIAYQWLIVTVLVNDCKLWSFIVDNSSALLLTINHYHCFKIHYQWLMITHQKYPSLWIIYVFVENQNYHSITMISSICHCCENKEPYYSIIIQYHHHITIVRNHYGHYGIILPLSNCGSYTMVLYNMFYGWSLLSLLWIITLVLNNHCSHNCIIMAY